MGSAPPLPPDAHSVATTHRRHSQRRYRTRPHRQRGRRPARHSLLTTTPDTRHPTPDTSFPPPNARPRARPTQPMRPMRPSSPPSGAGSAPPDTDPMPAVPTTQPGPCATAPSSDTCSPPPPDVGPTPARSHPMQAPGSRRPRHPVRAPHHHPHHPAQTHATVPTIRHRPCATAPPPNTRSPPPPDVGPTPARSHPMQAPGSRRPRHPVWAPHHHPHHQTQACAGLPTTPLASRHRIPRLAPPLHPSLRPPSPTTRPKPRTPGAGFPPLHPATRREPPLTP
ncbi:hypothetical protein EV192_105466 [Actinocrispum wychmicini]|uniref:Uncharacterized protein n=1 Tax=Actinocrispum wychmicini TaxID=1213861 RepID=A0A4R2JMR2_9PSEU|nr:hypothetical protein EV192_105466 [Actinocrispum wychmicini]